MAHDTTRDVRAGVNKYGSVTLGLQYACGGWMCMVSERIFGKTGAPAREITDITKARPGDILIKMNSAGTAMTHVCIFLGYAPAYTAYGVNVKPSIHTCDGNMNGEVYWDKCDGSFSGTILQGGLSDIGTRIHILTRYPD